MCNYVIKLVLRAIFCVGDDVHKPTIGPRVDQGIAVGQAVEGIARLQS
jgi:hypothetical protein